MIKYYCDCCGNEIAWGSLQRRQLKKVVSSEPRFEAMELCCKCAKEFNVDVGYLINKYTQADRSDAVGDSPHKK